MGRLRAKRPAIRAGTSRLQFIKRIPADIMERMVGETVTLHAGPHVVNTLISSATQSIRFSLKTTDNNAAKLWHAQAMAELEQVFASFRQRGPIELSHQQIVALSGEWYAARSRHPETYENFQQHWTRDGHGKWVLGEGHKEAEADEVEAEWAMGISAILKEGSSREIDLLGRPYDEALYGPIADSFLRCHGIGEITTSSRERLVASFRRTHMDAIRTSARVAMGDLSPDPLLARYVPFEPKPQADKSAASRGELRVTGMLSDWWTEAKRDGASINTFINYTTHVNQFVAFLGHDDARRVLTDDVMAFRDHKLSMPSARTKKPISARSFKSGALVALNSIFTRAVNERQLFANPVEGIVVTVRRAGKVRERDFMQDEIATILQAARALIPVPGSRTYKRELANKWIPWLCAYSGARVGEVAQLRKQDLRGNGDKWHLLVTPEAGTVKTKEFREVPLHAHIIEMGFLRLVEDSPEGYLFIDPRSPDVVHTAIATRSARVRDFVRGAGVVDSNVAPNHGWRHTFKTICTDADIEEKVQDAICGHAPSTTGRKYGTVSLKAKQAAMAKFPRYEV